MITLHDGTNTHTLPDDLVWVDEFEWDGIEQTLSYSLTGALVAQEGVKQTGRNITLKGGENYGWMPRSDIKALKTIEATPDITMVLTLHDGSTYNVQFRRPGAIRAQPVIDYANPVDADSCKNVTLAFIEV